MASVPVAVLSRPQPSPRAAWIESAPFDLTFFVLSPLLTLPIVFASLYGVRLVPALGFLLAFAHYLTTFTFYLWDDNREVHRARWAAFFAGPLAITAVFVVLVGAGVPLVIQFVIFFWNVFHVARQSCGIVSLYRHRAGVFDPAQKTVANGAILLVSVWLSLWNIETHHEVFPLLTAVHPRLPVLLWAGCGLAATLALARLAQALRVRAREGLAPALPELAILGTGLALFHPFLWLPDSGGATFAMLLPHYVQYLGLVWLLHRRRFAEATGSAPQRLLHHLARRPAVLVGALGSVTVSFLLLKLGLRDIGQESYFESFYLLLALVHFYLDGLFWAFRDPHVRRTIGPWLTRGPLPAAA